MRIGLDARFLSSKLTGIGKYCENLINHLSELDNDTEYLVLVQPDYTPQLKVGENFKIIHYNAKPVSLKTIFRLSRFLSKKEIPIFHSLFPLAPLFFKGKLLVTVHDIQPFLPELMVAEREEVGELISQVFYQWVYPRVLKRADWLITVSEATKNYLVELFSHLKEKIVVIHSGVTEEWFEEIGDESSVSVKKRYDLPENYILYEGGGRPSKNLKKMLRAFAKVSRLSQNFQNLFFLLILYDDGYIGEVKRLIRRLGLTEQVRIIYRLTAEERKVIYREAKVLFLVTKYEGFGFPLLEAQAVGTPVLASTSAALPEISHGAALLVDPDNEEAISSGLLRLLTDQALYQELVKRGYENVKNFSWRNTARRLLEVYNHLL